MRMKTLPPPPKKKRHSFISLILLFSIDLEVLSAKPIELYLILSLQKPSSIEQTPAQFDLKPYWHFLAKSEKALKIVFYGVWVGIWLASKK